ncbi:MAG: chemotaxis protein, partial [Alphaproteobacteria bacterium]|nr:chemotaxis protein [Alphaproteobacteria bacterium]
ACPLTEGQFVDLGARLESSIEILGKLTDTFGQLSSELKGENLQYATRDLSQIAARIAALGDAQSGEHGRFERLTVLTDGVGERVQRMGKSVKGVGMLAMNAKIAAANIGDAGVDFVSFATEIARTLKLAEASLGNFSAELAHVCGTVHAARASQQAFEERQTEAIRAIPARLATSVSSIAAQGKRAIAAAASVGDRSKHMGTRIGSAVMALQIGDTTRQRIEHVEAALGLFNDILGPGKTGADELGDCRTLSEAQRQSLIATGLELLSAQLTDTADEFDREVRQIHSALEQLAGDAREILRLGNDASGASETKQGTFLLQLEQEVGQVDALLNGFREARGAADHVAASVSQATASLVNQIGTVRSLEADIRIMGLNTTLKCGRLGTLGRPLSVIAQELRVYANQIATEASAVMTDLDGVVTTAGSLSGGEQERRTADIAAVAEIMANSVSRLGTAGESLESALATLERDSTVVAGLLEDTVRQITSHREIGSALRQAAAELARIVPPRDPTVVYPAAQAGPVFDRIARSYTMARERVIHDRHCGTSSAAAPAAEPPAAAQSLDDMLF